MSRTVALFVVLAVAAGPSAGLVCRALCSPHAAATTGCHDPHDPSAQTLADVSDCSDDTAAVAVVLSENGRRGGLDRSTDAGLFAVEHSVASSSATRSPLRLVSAKASLQRRPLSPILRI